MEPNKNIDVHKTEKTGADPIQYGDACDLGLTHYLGNDENKPREEEIEKEPNQRVGYEAHGNVESE